MTSGPMRKTSHSFREHQCDTEDLETEAGIGLSFEG